MEEKKTNKVSDLLEKWGKSFGFLVAGVIGVVAIALCFVPFINGAYESGSSLISLWPYGDFLTSCLGFYFAFAFLVLGVVSSFLFKVHKDFATVAMVLFLMAACMFIATPSFLDLSLDGIRPETLGEVSLSWAGIIVTVLCFVAAFADLIAVNRIDPLSVGEMAEMGILIGLAIVLDMYVSFDIAATGGSLNFAIIPLYLIALRSGPAKGFIAGGIVFGFLTCLTDGYGFYFFPFDYLIGWGSIAVIGMFRKLIFKEDTKEYDPLGLLFLAIAISLSTVVRLFGACASSMVFYGYDIAASLAYNCTYVLPTAALGLVVMSLLYKPLAIVNARYSRSKLYQ